MRSLPPELQGRIIGLAVGQTLSDNHSFTNVRDWANMTGLLYGKTENTHLGRDVVDVSAGHLLHQLGIERNRDFNESEQLWRTVFHRVFDRSPEIALQIYTLLNTSDLEDIEVTTWEIYQFRISRIASWLLNTIVLQVVPSLLVGYSVYKTYSYWNSVVFSKPINTLMAWLKAKAPTLVVVMRERGSWLFYHASSISVYSLSIMGSLYVLSWSGHKLGLVSAAAHTRVCNQIKQIFDGALPNIRNQRRPSFTSLMMGYGGSLLYGLFNPVLLSISNQRKELSHVFAEYGELRRRDIVRTMFRIIQSMKIK